MPKRRRPGQGAIYQRHDHPNCPPLVDGPPDENGKPTKIRPEHRCRGRWVGVVNLGGIGKQRRRKVVYGTTHKEAAAKLNDLVQREASGRLTRDTWTVESWVLHWLDYIAPERDIRPHTLRAYRTDATNHIIPDLGHLRLDQLEPEHMRMMYRRMREAGLSGTTIRHARAVVRVILNTAVAEGKAYRNAAALAEMPRQKDERPPALTLEQARKVLAIPAEPSRWYAALWLGLRQGEALGLRWADVDLDGSMLWVRRAVQRLPGKGLVATELKTRASERLVPLPAQVRAHLMVAWATHLADLQARGDKSDPLQWYVWHRPDGRPLEPRYDWQAWRDLLKKAELPMVRLHSARATAASLLNDAGVDPRTVATILGHSQVRTTQNIYQRTEIDTARRAMAALEGYASEGLPPTR